jgi:hypothetical protein
MQNLHETSSFEVKPSAEIKKNNLVPDVSTDRQNTLIVTVQLITALSDRPSTSMK